MCIAPYAVKAAVPVEMPELLHSDACVGLLAEVGLGELGSATPEVYDIYVQGSSPDIDKAKDPAAGACRLFLNLATPEGLKVTISATRVSPVVVVGPAVMMGPVRVEGPVVRSMSSWAAWSSIGDFIQGQSKAQGQ